MDILDIHTHRMPVELGQAIQNCQPAEFDPLAGAYYSVGIHPWYLTRENLDRQWEMLLAAIQCPQVLAIGEAGLDKLVRTDYMLQQEVFEKQAMLAHEMKYPLVIHAVRSANEIICLRKKMKPSNPGLYMGSVERKNWLCSTSGKGSMFHWVRNIKRKCFGPFPWNIYFWKRMKV